MSSIAEKAEATVVSQHPSQQHQSGVEKSRRGYFLRSSSFQKLKCSAAYPFQLAGTKINRDAIKELFEALIIKARILTQNAFLLLSIIVLRIFGLLLVNISIKKLDKDLDVVCDHSKNTKNTLNFHQRLLNRIQKLQQHKKLYIEKLNSVCQNDENPTPISVPSKEQSKKFINDCKQHDESAKMIEFRNEIEILRRLSKIKELETMEIIKRKPTTVVEEMKNYLFILSVYVGSAIIFLQLLILMLALNTTTTTPPGLIFLIVSLLFIAYIVFKVFFMGSGKSKQQQKEVVKKSREIRNNKTEKTSAAPICSDVKKRESRSLTRTTVIDSKTLSKIKLF